VSSEEAENGKPDSSVAAYRQTTTYGSWTPPASGLVAAQSKTLSGLTDSYRRPRGGGVERDGAGRAR